MEYKPKNIDLSKVEIPEELKALGESLAEYVHDAWAIEKMKQGWIYGEKRDDNKKTHHCLVSYDNLPDSEKEYDRKTAMATIKFIENLGYEIVKIK